MKFRRALLALALFCVSAPAASQTDNSFSAFLDGLWPEAAQQGISRATFDTAFAGLTPDSGVIAATRRAPEYGKPFGVYIASLASASRISVGLLLLLAAADCSDSACA